MKFVYDRYLLKKGKKKKCFHHVNVKRVFNFVRANLGQKFSSKV